MALYRRKGPPVLAGGEKAQNKSFVTSPGKQDQVQGVHPASSPAQGLQRSLD
jgi:hypothetical protein